MQLNYYAYFNESGYSIAAQDYLLAMMQAKPDIDIKIHYLNQRMGLGISKNRQQLFTAMHKKPSCEPSMNFYHSIPARYRRPPGKQKHIGFCIFETINPPEDWISTMNNMDMILTASTFNKHVFVNNGVKAPVHVIPHCFDPNLFHKDVKSNGRYSQKTFISVGTWKTRKNWSMLIKAWYEAFQANDNVCLLLKTNKPNLLKSEIIKIKRSSEWQSKNTAPIYCEENPTCDFEDIPSFFRKGDIYICASLGEGFGLNSFHAMALGIPVITTRFGGSLEYALPELCTYLEPERYRSIPVMDATPQFSNCIWPVVPIKEIAKQMRYVLSKSEAVQKKTSAAYDYVHKNFTYDVIGPKLLQVLEL